MKKIIALLMIVAVSGNVNAQSSKSKTTSKNTKEKSETTHFIHSTNHNSVKTGTKADRNGGTTSGTVPAAASSTSEGVIIEDSTTYDATRYNPYKKFSASEQVPDQPAPGLENSNTPRKRLPNTDVIMEPRK